MKLCGQFSCPHIFYLFRGNPVFEVIFMTEKQKNQSGQNKQQQKKEKPVSRIYPVLDNDLARDNVENDITAADLQDL